MKLSFQWLALLLLSLTLGANAQAEEETAESELRAARTIYLPSCDTDGLELNAFCRNKRGMLSQVKEKEVYDDEREDFNKILDDSKLNKKHVYQFLGQVKTANGEKVKLFENVPSCKDAGLTAGTYCKVERGNKKNRHERLAKTYLNSEGELTYGTLTRKEILDYLEQNKYSFTETRPSLIQKPALLQKTEPQNLKTIGEIKAPTLNANGVNLHLNKARCESSVLAWLLQGKDAPQDSAPFKAAAEFMKIQGKITMNRLMFAYLAGRQESGRPVDATTFGIQSAVKALLKTRQEKYADLYRQLERAPVSTFEVNKVIPAIYEILQEQQKKDPSSVPDGLALNETDVKLLGWLAQGEMDEANPKPVTSLKFAQLINSKVLDKNMSPAHVSENIQVLKAEQEKLEKDFDRLVESAMSSRPECKDLLACDSDEVRKRLKDSKTVEALNHALYKSLKLSKSDLVDLKGEPVRPALISSKNTKENAEVKNDALATSAQKNRSTASSSSANPSPRNWTESKIAGEQSKLFTPTANGGVHQFRALAETALPFPKGKKVITSAEATSALLFKVDQVREAEREGREQYAADGFWLEKCRIQIDTKNGHSANNPSARYVRVYRHKTAMDQKSNAQLISEGRIDLGQYIYDYQDKKKEYLREAREGGPQFLDEQLLNPGQLKTLATYLEQACR